MDVPPEIVRARETGQPVRVHTSDGEVIVARVLGYNERMLVYTVLSSSRPERYAVCDSTGFVIPISEIERARLLEEPRRSRQRRDLEQKG